MSLITHAFIVLGHEITFPSHELSESSKARCRSLHNSLRNRIPKKYVVIFMGKGRFQRDCPLSISQCMHHYFSRTYFPLENYHLDFDSLDTVGDAVYSLQILSRYSSITEVDVITSDWHILRAATIFNAVHALPSYTINCIASEELASMSTQAIENIIHSERNSLARFRHDFPDHIFIQDWVSSLRDRHSLYQDI